MKRTFKKRNRDSQTSLIKHLECLNKMKSDFKKNGILSDIYSYPRNFSISSGIIQSLEDLQMIRRLNGNGKKRVTNGTFEWIGDSEITTEICKIVKEKTHERAQASSKRKKEEREKQGKFIFTDETLQASNPGYRVDDVLEAYDMLPDSINKEDRKRLAKEFAKKFAK
jgi:hypothetical protein